MVHAVAMGRFHVLAALGLVPSVLVTLSCESTRDVPPASTAAGSRGTRAAGPARAERVARRRRRSSTSESSLECLGVEAPITLAGGLPYVTVTVGDAPKYPASFLLDYGTNVSTIDLSKFAPPGPSTAGCDPTKLGQLCSFADLDFFGPWGQVSLRTAAHGDGAGAPQAGILGTDFTSRVAVSIDYARSKVRRAFEQASFCTESAFVSAGFAALPTAGFFTNDPSKLRPLADVIAGSPPRFSVANVPTVPLRVAGVTAHAQLDTGFDDALVPFSVNVNEAFLAAVTARDPSALVRAADKDLSLTTCAGVAEAVEAYALGPGAALDFVGEAGQAVKSFPSATLFVKRTPEAAKKCGGIGTWTVPAAQVAASFYVAFGVVAFDPFGSRVWVK